LLRQVIEHDPPSPRQRNRAIPLDLERIILKAIAKAPDDRYATAQALADDLERFLQQRPIQARPLGRIARAWRWCRRLPAFAGVLSAVLFLLLCVTGMAVMFAFRETIHRQQAEARIQEAEWQQYLSDMHSAMAAWENSNVRRTLELLERHRPRCGEPDLRDFEWNYLWRQCQDKRPKLTINETSFVSGVSFSHDGHMLATGNIEGFVRVRDATSGRLIHEFKEQRLGATLVAFSPVDSTLASADLAGTIHLRELADSHSLRTLTGQTGELACFLFSSDGKQLASRSEEDMTIHIWDVATGHPLRVIRPQIRTNKPAYPVALTDNRLWLGPTVYFGCSTPIPGMNCDGSKPKSFYKPVFRGTGDWSRHLQGTVSFGCSKPKRGESFIPWESMGPPSAGFTSHLAIKHWPRSMRREN
jgi:hypothetical protein